MDLGSLISTDQDWSANFEHWQELQNNAFKAAPACILELHYRIKLIEDALNARMQDEDNERALEPGGSELPLKIIHALIKAECALADIAEGERDANETSSQVLEFAESISAQVLTHLRPVMKQYGIATSEWPPT
jgi:hypothetical protein